MSPTLADVYELWEPYLNRVVTVTGIYKSYMAQLLLHSSYIVHPRLWRSSRTFVLSGYHYDTPTPVALAASSASAGFAALNLCLKRRSG